MGKIILRDYQQQIIDELKHLASFYLLMGTGTGKTITSLESLKHYPTTNLLVICPKSAIKQWQNVLKEHYSYNVIEYPIKASSSKIEQILKDARPHTKSAIIINYEMTYRIRYLQSMVDSSWTIIADEIHRIRNVGTHTKPRRATKAVLELGEKTPYKIGLTATPVQGNFGGYVDYWAQLSFLGLTNLTFKKYYDKYVLHKEVSYGGAYPVKKVVGYQNTEEIDSLLQKVARRYVPKYDDFEPQFMEIMLERTKKYPSLLYDKAYVNKEVTILLNNSARTRIAKKTLTSGTIMGYDFNGNKHVFEDNTVKIDWVRDFLEDTDEVVSIIYTYNVELDSLKKVCEDLGKTYIVINGATQDKYTLVNNGGYDVVLGQYKAIAEALDGLHLFCHIEVLFSMPESSLDYVQVIGRIDRIGQTKVPMYYFLVMENTIDEAILKKIKEKVEFSQETLELLEV